VGIGVGHAEQLYARDTYEISGDLNGNLSAMLSGHQLQRYTASKGSLDPNRYIFVRYKLTKSPSSTDFDQLAVQLALSASLGSVNPLPFEDDRNRHRHSALVVSVEEIDAVNVYVELAFPITLFSPESGLPHLCTLVCYPSEFIYSGGFWVENIELPPTVIETMPGPTFGSQGILSKFKSNHPLFGIITKPRLGPDLATILGKAKEALEGGADLVIEDELIHCSMTDCTFTERVRRSVDVCRQAELHTGLAKGYIPNVAGPLSQVVAQIDIAKQAGALAVQVNTFSLGLGGLVDLVSHHNVGVPIIDCSVGIGLLSRPPFVNGISESVWACFSRLSGSDGYYTGITGMHVWYTRRSVRRTLHAITDAIRGKRPALPVGASGINPANVWDAANQMGSDSLLLSGTGILSYPGGPKVPCQCIQEVLRQVPCDTDPVLAHAAISKLGERNKKIGEVLDAYNYGKSEG